MAPSTPLLAVRGSEGFYMVTGPPSFTENTTLQRDFGKNCKVFAFSKDGTLFAWCNGEKVNIVKVASTELLHSFDLPKAVCLEFSPKNNVLATWQAYTTAKDGAAGMPNLQLYDVKTGKCLKSFIQKKMQNWCPCWADDESISARIVNNEVHFFENNNFDTIANKLHLQKVNDFVLSPGPQPSKVSVYVPGSKGAPSFVRLYQYPNFGGPQSALANKSFFKADKATMLWNNKATAVLVIASTEVDKTGASYYGEQTLHYIATNGESAVVQLPKNGPIYDVVWNPNSTEFCAVYGFMPAKATVFNLKCDPLFDFGTGPRNAAYYSSPGHILVLAGFGNLRGQMEVWDVKNYKLISKPLASDSTYFAWCPDGEHFVTATCAPRLRVGNGYKIWHYTGSVLHKCEVPPNAEIWQVSWQPFLDGTFPAKAVTYQAVPSELPSAELKVAQAYRPPALRNKPITSSKLHEEEPPQNMKPQPGNSDKPLSKMALKNQRKHEAKKAAKQEAKTDGSQESTPSPALQDVPRSALPSVTSGDPEVDKKIKNLKKKLKAIEQLKDQAATGKQLEKNQLEKIQKEAALLKELEDLELGF
ncbi:eukaryotic translation initiation factor 2A [Malaclemys terrapin pileata]|uniref:Eukaryotic translation initiation factor 2A n=1 Tax=Chrysemys picta bellii TaxID=8478 RepID=A0A8C3HLY6_CHRPI|nr:eukaryotic translation initiation factor 2A isoform X1 [Chrysemys picta bellii]XP_053895106.1 eukaryotic translation initiation factor 2A [Malaclemys terrapin pileata]